MLRGMKIEKTITKADLSRRYVTEGATIGELAAEYGVTNLMVRRALAAAGIPIRTRGGGVPLVVVDA
jgi:uncharacterized protein (DUF433 family)